MNVYSLKKLLRVKFLPPSKKSFTAQKKVTSPRGKVTLNFVLSGAR